VDQMRGCWLLLTVERVCGNRPGNQVGGMWCWRLESGLVVEDVGGCWRCLGIGDGGGAEV
jgi:hypothetical protein